MFQGIEMYFYIEIQSTIDMSKSKFIPNYLYIWSQIIYSEISQAEIHGIEINILTVTNGNK